VLYPSKFYTGGKVVVLFDSGPPSFHMDAFKSAMNKNGDRDPDKNVENKKDVHLR